MEDSLALQGPANLPTLTEDDQDDLRAKEAPNLHCHSQMFIIANDKKINQLPMQNKKRFVCMFCSKVYQQNCRLQIHMRCHTGERPYKCSYCGKGFSYSGNRNVHNRTHTGEKPFICPNCGQAFRAHGQLNEHEVRHMKLKPYVCMKCNKTFTRKSNLKLHEDIHLGLKHFECTVQGCHKYFTTKGNMKKHIMTHQATRLKIGKSEKKSERECYDTGTVSFQNLIENLDSHVLTYDYDSQQFQVSSSICRERFGHQEMNAPD